MAEQPPPEESIPDDLSPTELTEQKLLTERGRKLYKIRGKTVEPVLGQIRDVRGFDRPMRPAHNITLVRVNRNAPPFKSQYGGFNSQIKLKSNPVTFYRIPHRTSKNQEIPLDNHLDNNRKILPPRRTALINHIMGPLLQTRFLPLTTGMDIEYTYS